MNTAPELYVVSDLDDVWIPTVEGILEYSNEALDQRLSLDDFSEDFPTMWGLELNAASELWRGFCEERMPYLPLVEGAEEVIEGLHSAVRMDVLTARRLMFSGITRAWVERHHTRVTEVHFANIDWANDRHAHNRTKLDDVLNLNPDLYVEDQPKHALPVALHGISTIIMNRPWNLGVELPSNVQRVQCIHHLGDVVGETAERLAA